MTKEENDLIIEKLKGLPITFRCENTWVNKKYVPITLRLVELDKATEAAQSLAPPDPNGMADEQIEEKIREWHLSDSKLPLHTYIGMTLEQYKSWI